MYPVSKLVQEAAIAAANADLGASDDDIEDIDADAIETPDVPEFPRTPSPNQINLRSRRLVQRPCPKGRLNS